MTLNITGVSKWECCFKYDFIQLRYSEKINASSLCLMMGCLKRRGHYFWYLAPLNIEHMLHWLLGYASKCSNVLYTHFNFSSLTEFLKLNYNNSCDKFWVSGLLLVIECLPKQFGQFSFILVGKIRFCNDQNL